ncbi:threonylcarbamoyladenylate synthase [Sporobolomyces koalae]|uniref:threonylcarbamoyladenylate synthase n=1 Tax=Sporobolomyces koalae TaxID=500713 RepID=UPI0031753578
MSSRSASPIASTSSSSTRSPMHSNPGEPPAVAQLLSTDSPSTLTESLETASRLLHSHLPVAFPTETVYGLGASALSSTAVKRIFEAKGRPSDNPLIVHVGSKEMLHNLLPRRRRRRSRLGKDKQPASKEDEDIVVTGMNEMYERLMDTFWPGPLSFVFNLEQTTRPSSSSSPSSESEDEIIDPVWTVAPEVTANRPSLCVRMPSHPLALRLLQHSNLPLAAPSANLSSRPSPTSARHVMNDLGTGRGIGAVIDGGDCEVGVESTVVDYVEPVHPGGRGQVRVLRAGGVSAEAIEECLRQAGLVDDSPLSTTTTKPNNRGNVQVYSRDFQSAQLESNPTTPGMKYKHYSPGNSKVILVKPVKNNKFLPSLQELVQLSALTQSKEGRKFRVGLMLLDQTLPHLLESPAPPSSSTSSTTDPIRVHLSEPPASLFAQLTDNEESNLPTLASIETWSLSLGSTPQDAARRLFAGLRYFDSMPLSSTTTTDSEPQAEQGGEGVDLILVECVEEKEVGLAVMERARKAAGGIERGGEMEFAI